MRAKKKSFTKVSVCCWRARVNSIRLVRMKLVRKREVNIYVLKGIYNIGCTIIKFNGFFFVVKKGLFSRQRNIRGCALKNVCTF